MAKKIILYVYISIIAGLKRKFDIKFKNCYAFVLGGVFNKMMYAVIEQREKEYLFLFFNDSERSKEVMQMFQLQGHADDYPFIIFDNYGNVIHRSANCNILLDSDKDLFIHIYDSEEDKEKAIPDKYMAWLEHGGVQGNSIKEVIQKARWSENVLGRLCTRRTSAKPKIKEIHDYPENFSCGKSIKKVKCKRK